MTENGEAKPNKTIAEAFDEAFPHYLAMGMTYQQFWEQDCMLVIAYRKAYRLRQEQQNQFAWLQGLYIWKALQSAPVFVNGFVPKGATIEPYWDKPYEFIKEKKPKPAENNQKKIDQTVAYMQNLTSLFNRSFAERNKDNSPDERSVSQIV